MIDTRTAPYAAFALRIALGLMFIAHALLKYYVFTLPGTAQFFQSLGLPGALGYFTFFAELVGGALILAGIGTRWVAAALVPVLLGATWAHLGNGWLFTATGGGWEYPAFLTVAAAAQALLGDGAYAASSLFRQRPALRTA
ncbi:MAG: DoxX family protein [Burkholderiales bacterium]|jgi:putative oxidoreductase|nr:DoxX family protein [Burkholderiales bacterium]